MLLSDLRAQLATLQHEHGNIEVRIPYASGHASDIETISVEDIIANPSASYDAIRADYLLMDNGMGGKRKFFTEPTQMVAMLAPRRKCLLILRER